jgi:addiction module RelE/StbE family toxin
LWKIVYAKTFVHQYQKLDLEIQKRVYNVIRDLQHSEDPAKLGIPKKGQLKNMYAAYVGKYRIIYDIYRKEITIYFVYVGTHKDVYGTD